MKVRISLYGVPLGDYWSHEVISSADCVDDIAAIVTHYINLMFGVNIISPLIGDGKSCSINCTRTDDTGELNFNVDEIVVILRKDSGMGTRCPSLVGFLINRLMADLFVMDNDNLENVPYNTIDTFNAYAISKVLALYKRDYAQYKEILHKDMVIVKDTDIYQLALKELPDAQHDPVMLSYMANCIIHIFNGKVDPDKLQKALFYISILAVIKSQKEKQGETRVAN